MRSGRLAVLGLVVSLVAGCVAPSHGDLAYAPSPETRGLIARTPMIGGVTVTDHRKEGPYRLATVLGGYGNPLATFDTTVPVKDEVARVFAQALAGRGNLSPDGAGPYALAVELRALDADRYFRSQARVELGLQLVDRAGGRIVYADAARDRTVIGYRLDPPSSRELGGMAQAVLNRAVDRLVDNPRFQAFMGVR